MMTKAKKLVFLTLFSWPILTSANDFPTQPRVEYVLKCMNQLGKTSYQTLYPCVCMVDKVAAQMNYDEFSQAQTFTYLRGTPGERGSVFRDPYQSKTLRKKLKEAETLARKACFVG